MISKWATGALLLLCFAVPNSARAAQQRWRVTSSAVSYTLLHKFHTVVGKSHTAEGAALIGDDGARVMARIPVKSFDSGNANRDAHMLEAVDGAAYPFVVLKGRVTAEALRAAGKHGEAKLDAELDFHGVKDRRTIAVKIDRSNAKTIVATFNFAVSLTRHKVERPSLLFIKVKDEITIAGSLKLEPK